MKEVCPSDAKRYSPSRRRSFAPLIRRYSRFSHTVVREFRFYDRRVCDLSARIRFFLRSFRTFGSSNRYATARSIVIPAVKFYIDFRSPSLETSFEPLRGRNSDILSSSSSWSIKRTLMKMDE